MSFSEDDEAFVRWASKRHAWLWRVATGRGAFKSKAARDLAQRALGRLVRLDRLAWRLGMVSKR